MKNLELKNITVVIISILFSYMSYAQNDTSRIWVTFDQSNEVPVLKEGKLISTNPEIQQLVESFSITRVEQAVPASRRADLLKVYEVECLCDRDELNAQIERTKGMTDPVRAPEYELLTTPDDYNLVFNNDYALDLINAQGAWNYTTGDSNIVLGISDGGFFLNHEELENEYVSAFNSAWAPIQYKWHGTAVATTAAGKTNNGTGKSSIGYECHLALNTMGYNKLLELTYGGAKVINASWAAGCWYHPYYQAIIDEIYDNGTILVAAAGNGGTCGGSSNYVYPAAFERVIAVSSIGPNDNHERTIGDPATTHQHNDAVDICAPGYDVALTVSPGWYLTGNGTSFAAPYVTGTIGLMLSIKPCLTFEQILSILQSTASDLDAINPNYAGLLGAGRLDAGKALQVTAELPDFKADIAPGMAAICGNDTTTLSVTTTAGIAPFTFTWYSDVDPTVDGATTQSIDITIPGEYSVVVVDSTGCATAYSTIEVADYTAGIYVDAGSDITICADPVPTIQLDGSSPITGEAIWTNYEGTISNENDTIATYTPSANELAAGIVHLKLVSENNYSCPVESDELIINLTKFDSEVNSVIKKVSCFGEANGAINLTVEGQYTDYTFNWSNSATTEDINDLESGEYTVIITDPTGCTDTNTYFIGEPAPLTVQSIDASDFNGYNVSCPATTDGSIDITVVGGTHPYYYEWSSDNANVSTDEDPSALGAGDYTVLITDENGCMTTANTTLTAPEEIVINSNIVEYASGDNITCFGEADGKILLDVVGGVPGYTYNWTTANGAGITSTAEDQSGITAGIYTVLVTDMNGCEMDESFTLTQPAPLEIDLVPSVFPSGDNISCFGANDGTLEAIITGGSADYTYDWQTNNGSGLIANSASQSGLGTGFYWVDITDINGCTTTDEIVLTQPEALEVDIFVLTDYYGQAVSCLGMEDGSVKASATGGFGSISYAWNTNPVNTNPLVENIGAGVYTVEVTDENDCTATATVELTANPNPVLDPTPAVSACHGETITFSSNSQPNETCLWTLSNGMMLDQCGPNSLYIDEPGCYDATLEVTNNFQCTSTMTMENYICIHANPIADFTPSSTEFSVLDSEVSFENNSVGAVEFEWDMGDGNFSYEDEPYYMYAEETPGEYTVILYAYNEFGCMDSTQKVITSRDELLFFIPNSFTPNGDERNNSFKPVFGAGYSSDNYQLVIFNRWGETVFESQDMAFGWDGTTPSGEIATDGTYTWKMILQSDRDSMEKGERGVYHGHVNIIR